MAADPLTPAVSDRICRHMNDDHKSAVAAYARHYGNCPQVSAARLVAVTTEWMELDVGGQPLRITFDHPLADSEDAHRTLVAMLRAIPG
ncbi:MAG: heme iron utilization protein [Candidatus Synechococcus spongiarum SP3]|uniref:Heme iron utilization protein n=1 Tax=Candidatus Synechococcus spongiarum SP3 TaxID=1604020 RepID=A0A0G2HLP0_9SYNE|nr:MAG: heme iron utilization protein [Candidatus Synechococcus spongiarum SP3]